MPIALSTSLTGSSTSASQGSVSVALDSTYVTGNYLDGPAYVVAPSGCTFSSVTPAETTISTDTVNGAMKNPQVNAAQAFDERTFQPYSAANKATFPLAMSPGDVLVKAISSTDGSIVPGSAASTRLGIIDEWAAIFVVSSAPAAGTMSPAAVGWTGRGTPTAYAVDVPAFVAALPSYSTTGQTIVPYADIIDSVCQYNPVAWMQGANASPNYALYNYQELSPRTFSNTTVKTNYGEDINEKMNAAHLALISDGYTTAQKEAIATALISHGIQWYDPLIQSGGSLPNGGHFQWHFGCVSMGLEAMGRSKATAVADAGINFYGAFQVTATQASKLVNHVSGDDPALWRTRGITAVSGTTITIETERVGTTFDGAKISFQGGVMTRISDGATATCTGPLGHDPVSGSGTVDITIDAQPGSPFLVNDDVYFDTPFPVSAGDYDWAINGPDVLNIWSPLPDATYRASNKWTGQVLFMKAAGYTGDYGAVYGYVQRANTANDPTASLDYADHHGNSWDGEFWSQHAATIFA